MAGKRKPTSKQRGKRVKYARLERGASDQDIAIMVCRQCIEMIQEGRIPSRAAVQGMEMAIDEVESGLLDGSVSWAVRPELAQIPNSGHITSILEKDD